MRASTYFCAVFFLLKATSLLKSSSGVILTLGYLGHIEEQIGQQYTGTVPQLHKGYIDNVLGIVCCSRVELEDYIAFVSNFHPALQFTHTISETELPFLDINLLISGNHIRSSIHCKATDTHSFCTTIHHIPTSSKRASYRASFYAFDASVLTKPTF